MTSSANWTRWYREGTVNVTQDSPDVTGTSTYWSSASIKPGDIFSLDGITDYEVLEVVDDTHLTLATNWAAKTASTQSYFINRSFSSTTESQVAAQTASLVSQMARYVDTDLEKVQGLSAYEVAKANGYTGTVNQWLQSLVGKSAYEVAVSGGYTGTQAEWLESLKAAAEWSKLDTRTKMLDNLFAQGPTHNSFWGGRDLGLHPTAEMYKAIRTQHFTDLYVGDMFNGWATSGNNSPWHIAGFNLGPYSVPLGADPLTGETRLGIGGKLEGWNRYIGGRVTLFKRYAPEDEDTYYSSEDKNADGTFVGYTQCHWYRNRRAKFLRDAIETFGAEHLYEWSDVVPTGYNAAGEPSGWARVWMRCELPTYGMLYEKPAYMRAGTKAGEYVPTPPMSGNQYEEARFPSRTLYSMYPATILGSWCRDIWGLTGTGGHLMGNVVNNIGLIGPADTRTKRDPIVMIMIGSQSEEDDSKITVPDEEEGE